MNVYHTKSNPLHGTDWKEVAPKARHILRGIASRTKRRPYIRSAYFRKDKIFFTFFWNHLSQKPLPEQLRRIKYLPCAIELIRHSRAEPITKENPNKQGELLHRFGGVTPDGQYFMVQIKEFRKTDIKELMSVFPYDLK